MEKNLTTDTPEQEVIIDLTQAADDDVIIVEPEIVTIDLTSTSD